MALKGFSGTERDYPDDEIIVTKTDLKGLITYCNESFLTVSGHKEADLIGKPHNLIRHPAMPGVIFKMLWDAVSQGKEMFAYVVDSCKSGEYYWAFSHFSADFDQNGAIIGYHSNRRHVDRKAIDVIIPLYARLCEEEQRHTDRKAGIAASFAVLTSILAEKGVDYEQFVLGL